MLPIGYYINIFIYTYIYYQVNIIKLFTKALFLPNLKYKVFVDLYNFFPIVEIICFIMHLNLIYLILIEHKRKNCFTYN